MEAKIIVAVRGHADCEALINKFAQSTTHLANFSDFAQVWRSTNFDLIFSGRHPEELSQLTCELFGIAKGFILNTSSSYTMRVGALYILYGLYFTMKKNYKVRITLSELKLLLDFLETLKQNYVREAIFVFNKLLVANAFHFCATPSQYIQINFRCQSEDDTEMADNYCDHECRLIQSDGVTSNIMEDIKLLHSKYEDLKSQLPEFKAQNSSQASANRNFVTEICTILDGLKTSISDNKENRNEVENVTNYQEDCDESVADCPSLEENQGSLRQRIGNAFFEPMEVSESSYWRSTQTRMK